MGGERAMKPFVTLEIDFAAGHTPAARALSPSMEEARDRDAVELLRRRDGRGFDLAYARYADRIFGFLVRLSRSRALAEDLFQVTFLRLAEQGPRLRADSDLRAWLFAVARNAYYSHTRRRADDPHPGEAGQSALAASNVEARLELDDLERALSTLGSNDRELLLLVGAEHMTVIEVAALLEIDQATARKRLSRARERLSRAFTGPETTVAPRKRTP